MNNLNVKVRKRECLYVFEVEGFVESYEIWGSKFNDLSDKILLQSCDQSETAIEANDNDRMYFEIIDKAENRVVVSSRLIKDTSIKNFRDIGGYRTKENKSVKWGMLYRSGSLDHINAEDEEYLINLGIKTIFDFRSNPEVTLKPDVTPKGLEYINRSGIITMDEEEYHSYDKNKNDDSEGNLDMRSLILKHENDPVKLKELSSYLFNAYGVMAEHSGAFKDFFRTLLDKKGEPILFHCTAGKDRTGVAAALVLYALGVPKETILEDYLATNRYREKEIATTLKELSKVTQNELVLETVKDLFRVKEEYINHLFAKIKDLYGSVDNFLYQSLELTDDDINTLKEIYLQD